MNKLNKSGFNILFTCTGNICRSPSAEAILKKLLPADFKNDCTIESAGTGAMDGLPATLFAIAAADEHNVCLKHHRSQSINENMLERTDLIIALAENHRDYFQRYFLRYMDKIFLLKSFDYPDKEGNISVADPIGENLEVYRASFIEIEAEIKRILPAVIRLIEEYSFIKKVK